MLSSKNFFSSLYATTISLDAAAAGLVEDEVWCGCIIELYSMPSVAGRVTVRPSEVLVVLA